eukprot:9379580-Lingulodinium_polyedra.AAC.1
MVAFVANRTSHAPSCCISDTGTPCSWPCTACTGDQPRLRRSRFLAARTAAVPPAGRLPR